MLVQFLLQGCTIRLFEDRKTRNQYWLGGINGWGNGSGRGWGDAIGCGHLDEGYKRVKGFGFGMGEGEEAEQLGDGGEFGVCDDIVRYDHDEDDHDEDDVERYEEKGEYRFELGESFFNSRSQIYTVE